MKIVVTIPTYNEADNIEKLISQIEKQKFSDQNLSILVVDDTSPDGTGEIVRKIMRQDSTVHLLSGYKRGLGNAYIRGMKYALEKLSAEIVIEMDADFSHNPKDIVRLVTEIEKGEDFVIGSRYVDGGRIENWSFFRHWLSYLGNQVTRKVIGLNKTKDCTAGYRAIKAGLLRKINFDSIKANGYAFQVWLLYICAKKGAKIKEIPVDFVDRKAGKTKIGFWDIIEGIIILFKLRFNG